MHMKEENRQTVLIVDDSLLICEQIKAALKEEDISLWEAHSGQEAVEQLKRCRPDLILLDVVLPDTDGYELYNHLKDGSPKDSVIIFLTSKSSDEDVVRGFSMGACDYIKKPFVKKELQSRIHAHLAQKKQRDELDRQNRELRDSMEKLNYMAYRDGLTGLYNRRYVVGDLLEDVRCCTAGDVETVFVMADIDDFKLVNDTYGHDAGDMALICIANILEDNCRNHRVVRWGGEEFLMILFRVTLEEAYEISEKVRRQVEQFVIPYGAEGFSCTMTLGLHVFKPQEALEEGISCADKALYHGKRNGKNQSVWYESL
ncbi:diguanylate cyclase [Clostridium sp. FS41]|uniref:GGDEF domain-containing response regulator n=1 Tax=Clostridia TaxID=186801 RepID=UPI00061E7C13|nr:response regulator PleD [Clostridium sp. FS41]